VDGIAVARRKRFAVDRLQQSSPPPFTAGQSPDDRQRQFQNTT
jgi:hypothetical protein